MSWQAQVDAQVDILKDAIVYEKSKQEAE